MGKDLHVHFKEGTMFLSLYITYHLDSMSAWDVNDRDEDLCASFSSVLSLDFSVILLLVLAPKLEGFIYFDNDNF